MMSAPVDPRAAFDSANESDLVQKKLSIDAMRKRVSGGPNEEAKLRDACEGFESVFLQKMWEQMRKNVKKEGYLHSKDEEAYQSMFDVELSKKMASAGGIGLADMLYEQLSQKLHTASKTTDSGTARAPLPIEPARPPRPEVAAAPAAPAAPLDLYTEVAEEPAAEEPPSNPYADALAELAASRDPALDPANATYPMFDLQTGAPMNPMAEKMKEDSRPRREIEVVPLPERVSPPGRARPSNALPRASRTARHARRNARAAEEAAEALTAEKHRNVRNDAGAAPAEAVDAAPAARKTSWPVRGEIVSSYGRQPDNTWNTGMLVAADPGSAVTAPRDGTVIFAGEKDGKGQMVIAHEGGLTSHYANVVPVLAEGQPVSAGTEIARVSAGGGFSAAGTAEISGRVRFEVRRGELAVNPESLRT